jgi:hypothetical protein
MTRSSGELAQVKEVTIPMARAYVGRLKLWLKRGEQRSVAVSREGRAVFVGGHRVRPPHERSTAGWLRDYGLAFNVVVDRYRWEERAAPAR